MVLVHTAGQYINLVSLAKVLVLHQILLTILQKQDIVGCNQGAAERLFFF